MTRTCTRKTIERQKYTGWVRGEYFIGEWDDDKGTEMAGYPLFYVVEGEIPAFGSFSTSGNIEDIEYSGEQIVSHDETAFVKLGK